MLHYVWTWVASLIKHLSAAHSDGSSGEARSTAAEASVFKKRVQIKGENKKWEKKGLLGCFGLLRAQNGKTSDLIDPQCH